ncbi:hypothetical protein C8J56DRAFT_167553 [Mycena floridula]|nr:hypothetical protein C8J56DRAFT_167553 [Mycena floridula]
MSTTTFIATAAALSIPSFYFLFPGLKQGSTRSAVHLFLLCYTLFLLHSIIVLPPTNIFRQLDIGLATPIETLRRLLVKNGKTASKPLEQLITRMGSLETRLFYVRFGHNAVASCEHCHSFTDFLVYMAPEFILGYITEAAVMGVVTIRGTGRERFRTWAVGLLVVAAVVEAYFTISMDIRIPTEGKLGPRPSLFRFKDGVVMWHEALSLGRTIFFIVLPLLFHFLLPGSRSGDADLSPVAKSQVVTLQSLLTKLHLLQYTRGSISRSSALNATAQQYWNQDKREGDSVREDDAVRGIARRTGFGFDEPGNGQVEKDGSGVQGQGAAAGVADDNSKLRTHARTIVKGLLSNFRPSDYWKAP